MARKIHHRDTGDLAQLERKLGYAFTDLALLELALTHPSYTVQEFTDNERMEFLGDSVLSLAVSGHLYLTIARVSEGELTRIKSSVVSTVALARISRGLRLDEFMRIGRGLGGSRGLPDSVHANVMEAVFGAVYLDGGFDPARDVILRLVEPEIQAVTLAAGSENAKSQLQEHAQRTLGVSPRYRVISESGPQHGKVFVVAAEIRGRTFPPFSGHTKKEAEQGAARLALEVLTASPARPAPAPVAETPPAAVPESAAAPERASAAQPQPASPTAGAGRPRKGRRRGGRGRGQKQGQGQTQKGTGAGQRKPAAQKPQKPQRQRQPQPQPQRQRQPQPPPRPQSPAPRGGKGGAGQAPRKNPYDLLAEG